jgi:preprotein translocase subunit SecG
MELTMLSFMREEGFVEPSGQEPTSSPPVNGTAHNGAWNPKRNGVQGPRSEISRETQEREYPQRQENLLGAQQGYLTVTPKDKNARRSTILLVGLFILGLLCLMFMIKKSSPQKASASSGQTGTEEVQIETAITQLVGIRSEMFGRMGEIVKKFYEFSDVQQVKVDELVKNPFILEIFLSSLREKSDTKKGYLDNTETMRKTKGMRLMSIVATDYGKCCIIDDKRLYEGDSIGDFNIRQIGDRTVLLESNGIEIVLKLSE